MPSMESASTFTRGRRSESLAKVTARSILGILDRPGEIVDGEIHFRHRVSDDGAEEEVELTAHYPDSDLMRSVRGGEIAYVFQEPMFSRRP